MVALLYFSLMIFSLVTLFPFALVFVVILFTIGAPVFSPVLMAAYYFYKYVSGTYDGPEVGLEEFYQRRPSLYQVKKESVLVGRAAGDTSVKEIVPVELPISPTLMPQLLPVANLSDEALGVCWLVIPEQFREHHNLTNLNDPFDENSVINQ